MHRHTCSPPGRQSDGHGRGGRTRAPRRRTLGVDHRGPAPDLLAVQPVAAAVGVGLAEDAEEEHDAE